MPVIAFLMFHMRKFEKGFAKTAFLGNVCILTQAAAADADKKRKQKEKVGFFSFDFAPTCACQCLSNVSHENV